MAEIAVLGANGFVGMSLAEGVLARDADGTGGTGGTGGEPPRLLLGARRPFDVSSLRASRTERRRVETMAYGRFEDADLDRLARADAIVDLVSPGRGRFASQFDVAPRVAGHLRLADGLARRSWDGHLVFVSSGGTIYGGGAAEPIAETAPRRPASEYALEKAMVELHLETLARRGALSSTVLRVANVYGPRQPARAGFGVVPALAQALREGTPFTRYGTGEAVRDYVHVDDVVEAVLATARRRQAGTFNVGSGTGTSVNALIDMARELSGRTLEVAALENPAGEPAAVVLDCGLAARQLGWRARVGVREGLEGTLRHHGLVPPGR